MSASVAKFRSETGWDALAEELPMMARVMAGPATLEDLANVAGERDLVAARRRVSRLVREGLVVLRDERFEAPAKRIDFLRQEGLLTSLSLHILPTVTKLAKDPTCGVAVQFDLDLDEGEQETLCASWEKELIDSLDELSEQPAESKLRHTLVVYGTSDVPPPGPPSDRLLETLKRCVRQRSTPAVSSRALLMSYEAHFGNPEGASDLVRRAAGRFEPKRAGSRYTLVYAFCENADENGEAR